MKTYIVLVIIPCFFVISVWADYFRAQFISLAEAKKRWGEKKFNSLEFKSSDTTYRAPMAVDAVKNQLFVGKDTKKLREELGDPDGYFFSRMTLAYQIQVWTEQKKEAWQLVFIPDENQKVVEVKIQKKCCYEEPLWLKTFNKKEK